MEVGNPRDILGVPKREKKRLGTLATVRNVWMGRSLSVGRKSENLPVISYAFSVFSRFGTRCDCF